jgi:two-component system chemotaxis response regulator CheB
MEQPSKKRTLMIVDDSAVVRGLLTRLFNTQDDIEVISSSVDGVMALEQLRTHKPDVIILDIEMPRMDGFTALPQILELSPASKIIVSSTLSERNADISLEALKLGATEYVPKPTSRQEKGMVDAYYQEMLDKIRAISNSSKSSARSSGSPILQEAMTIKAACDSREASIPKPSVDEVPASAVDESMWKKFVPKQRPEVLAIASSTGGPQALLQIFSSMKGKMPNIPVFVTQHMPPTFTTIMAKHLSQAGDVLCEEAQENQAVQSGQVYIAPGDYHMLVTKDSGSVKLQLDHSEPVNFCRPSAEPMITSLLNVYGSRLMLLVLTGMGQDGRVGAQQVYNKGGSVYIQDKQSSTVWGMPKAVYDNNCYHGMLPLSQFAPFLQHVFQTGP